MFFFIKHASRGWFEDDDAFEARLKAIRETFTAKLKTKPKPPASYAAAVTSATSASAAIRKGAPIPSPAKSARSGLSMANVPVGSAAPVSGSKWVTPGQDTKKNAWGVADKKKKKKNKGSGVFAAMMANDDSESDFEDGGEYDSEDDQDNTLAARNLAGAGEDDDSPTDMNENDSSSPAKKKKGKKKKSKGGGKKKNEANMTEDELLNASVAANRAAEKAKEEAQEVSHPAIAFLKNYLIPFVLGFIAFIFSLFFGKPKQKQKKR